MVNTQAIPTVRKLGNPIYRALFRRRMTKEACEVETLLAQAMASRNGSAGDAMARALAGFATIGNR
jgi:hypothetical protein